MLESAEVGHTIAKATYAREEPKLREALIIGQFEMSRAQRGPILILISGLEGGGRGETANQLNEWMDPRFIRTHAFGPGAPEEKVRPTAWRYWRALPPRGRIGIFMNAWYRQLAGEHSRRAVTRAEFSAHLQDIRQHEQMLTDEGIVLLKFWIHLSREGQKRRLHELASNPKTRWRVTDMDKRAFKHYSKNHDVWEEMMREHRSARHLGMSSRAPIPIIATSPWARSSSGRCPGSPRGRNPRRERWCPPRPRSSATSR
jgi:polyphosphate kinase 2 (PPK2 family)